jgi:hypothetical protein
VHETGRREVIGIDAREAESEAFWREFLRDLVARDLSGARSASPTPTRAVSAPSPRSSAARGSAHLSTVLPGGNAQS